MSFRRSRPTATNPRDSQGLALAVALLAALAGCSSGSGDSGSTPPKDAGRSDAGADSLGADAPGTPDLASAPDLSADAALGPDTRLADVAGSRPESGDSVPESAPSPDAGTDSARGADAAADAEQRKDAGPEAGDVKNADTVSPDLGGPEVGSLDGADADPCAGGTTLADSTTAKTTITDYGWVRLGVAASPIVEFTTTMLVPESPAASGTLFLWPGLQPLRGGANYSALDNGVLQPVLTWGPTCAPNAPAQSYKAWWISGQYVNTNIASSSPNYASYHDCHGGPGMTVAVGDLLDMRFVLNGTAWTQTVTNRRTAQSVVYTIDLLGQAQASAEWVIEEYSSKPVSDVVFTSSVITFASSAKSVCQPAQRGANDYFSAPRVSADGLRCCIGKVILRAEGVAATTPNTP